MKKRPESHENLERWMVSYADFMTLLFALFVVLYSFAMAKQSEAKSMAESIAEAFNITPSAQSTSTGVLLVSDALQKQISEQVEENISKKAQERESINNGGMIMNFTMSPGASDSVSKSENSSQTELNSREGQADSTSALGQLFYAENTVSTSNQPHSKDPNAGNQIGEGGFASGHGDSQIADGGKTEIDSKHEGDGKNGHPFDTIKHSISQTISDRGLEDNIEVDEDPHYLSIRINSGLLFAEGSSSVLSASRSVILSIGNIIKPINNYVRVRGYTDNTFEPNGIFKNSWDLSAARAVNVLNELVQAGVAPERLACEAYGEFSPTYDNNTPAGRARNRCVVIAISRDAIEPKKLKQVPESLEEDTNDTGIGRRAGDGNLNVVRGDDASIKLNFNGKLPR